MAGNSGARSYLGRLWSALLGRPGAPGEEDAVTGNPSLPSGEAGRWEDEVGRYDVLDAYRASNDLYGRLRTDLRIRGYAGYQNLCNPANRVAELYATKLPDSLIEKLDTSPEAETEQPETGGPPDVAFTPEQLKGLILQVYEWSNWRDMLEVAARNFGSHGDRFVKIENSEDNTRVQKNLLDPRVVAEDFQKDERGFFTYLRLDIPQEDRDPAEPDEAREYTRTEVWDKEKGQYLIYEHEEGPGANLADLEPEDLVYSALLSAEPPDRPNVNWTGFDFIPVVHRKLKDTGEARGEGAYQHALDGIDAANWLATKLNAMLFPRIVWKGTRQHGPGGTAIGPFKLETEDPDDENLSRLTAVEQETYRVVDVGGDPTVMLPSGADLAPMVPDIDFKSHLDALKAHLEELEKDLPELAYHRLREMSDISGVAVERLLGDTIDRVGRGRAKFEEAEVRENKMALTIGKVSGVPGFEVIPEGAYEDGLLDHRFEPYELFPLTPTEKARKEQAEADSLAAWKSLGPELYAKKLQEASLGFSKQEALRIAQEAATRVERGRTSSFLNDR